MTVANATTLMDSQVWSSKIFDGDWIAPSGGEYAAVEPATGRTLGMVGRAAAADVRRAAAQAAEAHTAWARAPFLERAQVLRRAAALWQEHAAEIQDWLMRESGATPPMAGFQIHLAKPVNPEELVSTIYTLAGRSSQNSVTHSA